MTSFATDATIAATPLASLTYPRTGKRGVPQQFPRRLYEMLESEAKLANTDPDHQDIIAWSNSGKAFRIVNVALFASHVLPKYFRTSKFSSFQRNLNLYGFAKVRRGPDTDMYAHPSFVRGQPDTLSHLRKCNSTAARKRVSSSMGQQQQQLQQQHLQIAAPKIIIPAHTAVNVMGFSRTVSPTPPRVEVITNQQHPIIQQQQQQQQLQQQTTFAYHHIVPMPPAVTTTPPTTMEQAPVQVAPAPTHVAQPVYMPTLWHQQVTAPPPRQQLQLLAPAAPVSPGGSDSGRLDLLTMAMTSMAEREANTTQVAVTTA